MLKRNMQNTGNSRDEYAFTTANLFLLYREKLQCEVKVNGLFNGCDMYLRVRLGI